MMKKSVKQGSAILLALAVALSIFVLPGVWAASAIDVDEKRTARWSFPWAVRV